MSLAVLCSGQGGQHAAMFALVEREAHPDAIARLDRVAGFDLRATACAVPSTLFDNATAQPLIVAFQGLVWSLLAPRLATPGIVCAGYSIGELASHACAGHLAWTDAVALARERARLMDVAAGPDDGLLAVRGLTRGALDALPSMRGVHVAIVNGADQLVLGGAVAALERLGADAAARGGTTQRLAVGLAAHTPTLADAVAPFRQALEAAAWQSSAHPVLSGLDGSIVRDRVTAIDVLSRQIAATIRWVDCMDALHERGVRRCLELGPGNALARLMRDRHRDVDARAVSDFRSFDAVVDWADRDAR